MRQIERKGLKWGMFQCEFCHQVEKLTEGEEVRCSNCGTAMMRMEPTEDVKVVPCEVDKPMENKVETEEPKPRRKGGRPPKRKPGTCATCARALRSETGYTCELNCEGHSADDSCPAYTEGVPVGV